MSHMNVLLECGFKDHEDVILAFSRIRKTVSNKRKLNCVKCRGTGSFVGKICKQCGGFGWSVQAPRGPQQLLIACGFKSKEHVAKAVRNTQPIGGEA